MATTATATAPTITLKQIASLLADKHKLSKKAVNDLLTGYMTEVEKSLKKGARVRMGDLGILQVRKRAARMGRNPQTGEQIKIPAKKKIAFRPAKKLKEAVGK